MLSYMLKLFKSSSQQLQLEVLNILHNVHLKPSKVRPKLGVSLAYPRLREHRRQLYHNVRLSKRGLTSVCWHAVAGVFS